MEEINKLAVLKSYFEGIGLGAALENANYKTFFGDDCNYGILGWIDNPELEKELSVTDCKLLYVKYKQSIYNALYPAIGFRKKYRR